MSDIAYVNGSFCPIADAKVSVEDRGYQFADGVYEVIIAPRRAPFLLKQHLDRLRRSLEGIKLSTDIDALGVADLIADGIQRCGHDDVLVYVQISAGPAPRYHVRAEPCDISMVMTFRRYVPVDPAKFEKGVGLLPMEDMRWSQPCIKAIALLPNVLLRREAIQRGFDDAIVLGPEGIVRETTCANIFAVFGDTLWTPPASERILRGITRDFLLEFAAHEGTAVLERDKPIEELVTADEVFVTSTTQEAMPVFRIGDHTIGGGKPGPMTRRCAEALRSAAFHSPAGAADH